MGDPGALDLDSWESAESHESRRDSEDVVANLHTTKAQGLRCKLARKSSGS